MTRSVGIDIGSYSIKIVEVESTISSGLKISMLEEFLLSQDDSKDRKIEIIEILREFIPRRFNLLENTRFILSLPKDHYIHRNLKFPFRQRYKILKSLPFSLEDEIPFHKDEVIYELKILDFKDLETEVMVFVSQKKSIRSMIELAQNFHVSPSILSVGEVALLNAYDRRGNFRRISRKSSSLSSVQRLSSVLAVINQSLSLKKKKSIEEEEKREEEEAVDPQDDSAFREENEDIQDAQDAQVEKTRILLHLGHKSSFMLLTQRRKILSFKNFDWGGEFIAKNLSKEHGISFQAALQELQDNGFILQNLKEASMNQMRTSEMIKKSLASFGDDLYVSLLQCKEKFQLEYSEISLSGGISMIRNIEPELEKSTGIKIVRANQDDFSQFLTLDPHANEFKASFSVALGLALEGFKKSQNPPLNFLKDEFEREDQHVRMFMKKWSKALKVSLALVIFIYIYTHHRERLALKMSNQSYDAMKEKASKIAFIKGSKLTVDNVEKFIFSEQNKSKGKKLMDELLELNSPLDILKKLSESLPPRSQLSLNIGHFSVDQEKVLLKGYAQSEKVIDRLEGVVKKISKNKEVKKTVEETAGLLAELKDKEELKGNKAKLKNGVGEGKKKFPFLFTMEFEVKRVNEEYPKKGKKIND